MNHARPALVALILAPLFACDPASEKACADAAESEGVLDLGTGADRYEAIEDGATLVVNRGPQGGQHVYGSLHLEGIVIDPLNLDPDLMPVVDFGLWDGDTQIAGYLQSQRVFLARGAAVELVGETLILEYIEGGSFEGMEVTMKANVVDACGRALSAERTVTLAE